MKTVLGFMLLVISCTPARAPINGVHARDMPVTMQFAEGVPLLNRALIYSAADDWQRATGGAGRVEFVDGGTIDIRITDSGPLGKCTSTEMILRSDAPDELFRAAALHEIGHKFGMNHLPEGVMMANITPDENCIDELTLRVFCSAYHCANPRATCH